MSSTEISVSAGIAFAREGGRVMADEKEAFLRRLDYGPGEFSRVMSDVIANDATYVVKTTNTVQNSRSPEPFRPVAVIMPYERYQEMKQALAEMAP